MRVWLARYSGISLKGARVGSEITLIGVAALALSALLTGIVRRLALARGLLDVPNARSSHIEVTPRGGGLAMMLVATAASIALAYLGRIPLDLFLALVGGGTAVAAIGFMDDRRPMPAWLRLVVHVSAAIWALAWIGAPAAVRVGAQIIPLGWAGAILTTLGIVWTLNLFNFMDGIDGIAASEAIFMACGGALLMLGSGTSTGAATVGLILGATCCGFLLWNWPPAKIFMGDVGSGYLGYVIAILILSAARDNSNAVWVWLILGGAFFVDATVTLVRRTVGGDRIFEAHRSHAYQWLARRWGSHRRVTVALTALNLLWLFPCAYLTLLYPSRAAWIALASLTPLVIAAIAAGAGRRESA